MKVFNGIVHHIYAARNESNTGQILTLHMVTCPLVDQLAVGPSEMEIRTTSHGRLYAAFF